MEEKKATIVTALIQGKDTKGIIATITNWIFDNNGNIVYLDQHTDPVEDMFFMRIRWDMDGFQVPREELDEVNGGIRTPIPWMEEPLIVMCLVTKNPKVHAVAVIFFSDRSDAGVPATRRVL